MLRSRLLSASILIALVLTSIFLDVVYPILGQHGVWLVPLFMFFAIATAREVALLANHRWAVSVRSVTLLSAIACLIICFPVWYSLATGNEYPKNCPVGRLGWIVVASMVIAMVSAIQTIRGYKGEVLEEGVNSSSERSVHAPESIVLGWFISLATVVYVVGGIGIWWAVRMHGEPNHGLALLIAMIAVIKLADTGAYFVGKRFGKTKLAPIVSPGKTYEGLAGGLLFSTVGAYIAFRWVLPQLGVPVGSFVWGPLVIAFLLTIVGLIGDLMESTIKRAVGAKDSGNSLPGLGGLWDVTDSLLPTSIVSYLVILAQLT